MAPRLLERRPKGVIMNNLRIPVAMAASVIAFTYASSSFADDADDTDETEVTSTTTQPTPAQQPAPQPTYVQPAPVVVQQPAATTTTTAAPYYPPGSDTSERTIERRPNRTLLSTGAGIFVLSYGASAIAGAISDRDADKNLFIPVVGPWIDLGDRNCSAAEPCGSNEDINKAMIITSGVVQGAGLLLAIGSLVIPETTSVKETRTTAKHKPSVSVAPLSFRSGAGVGAIGTF
jgi:hypothetical protein